MDTDELLAAEELVALCNRVLVRAGLVARVGTLDEVLTVCSSTSLFVAALEGFLRKRIPGVVRQPSTAAERAYNIIQVVEALSLLLQTDLSHIDGRRCVEGQVEDVANLLELLDALGQGQPLLDAPGEAGSDARRPAVQDAAESVHGRAPRGEAGGHGGSHGGSSSCISIPVVNTEPRRTEATAAGAANADDEPEQHLDPRGYSSGSSAPGSGPASGVSESTGTLLERAMSEADATLQELQERSGQRAGGARSGRRAKSARAHVTGTEQQQRAFFREARRRLGAGSGAVSIRSSEVGSEVTAGSERRLGRGGAEMGTRRQQGTGGRRAAGVAGFAAQARAAGVSTRPALRVLPGSSVRPGIAASRQARTLMQRTAASYTATLAPAHVVAEEAEKGLGPGDDDVSWEEESLWERDTERDVWLSDQGTWARTGGRAAGLQLTADLAAKLRYVYGLAHEDPKDRAARARTQRQVLAEEAARAAARRQLLERLARARSRRDGAMRLTADRLREQSEEHSRRVEQLRLERLAEQWRSQQHGMHMRQALRAELALRDAFLEVLQGEKERLLEERRMAKEARRGGRFPHVASAMRRAEEQYLSMYDTLVGLLASERQQRVAAARETQRAVKSSATLQASVVHDRLLELLGRVARDEEAMLWRAGRAAGGGSRTVLVGQIRRVLGLA